MAQLTLENLSKKFGQQEVVHDFSLTVESGEFMVLAGPSGCGKSTILRMIAGLEECDEGAIYLGDRKINDVAPKDRDIAIVFQNYALYPHMTAYENMAFGLKIRKMDKKEIHERVREAASILEITELLDRKPAKMSGGQRQRVAIGRAIVREPKLFLFDEPLSNLDASLRTQMRYEIASLHKKLKTTVVYVTHDQVEAMTLADRITVMKKGECLQTASPADIYHFPQNQFVAGFIGSPAMNFIEGVVIQKDGKTLFQSSVEGISWPFKSISSPENYIGKKMVAGIRPEDFSLIAPVFWSDIVAISSDVTHVEWLGFDGILYANVGTLSWRIRIQTHDGLEIQGPTTWYIDPGKCHYFDFTSGMAIKKG